MRELDVIFLVPGFLGFERFEAFAYFADRVGTALRSTLAERLDRRVLVVPVAQPPAESLARRQVALARTLTRRAQAIREAERRDVRVHLLGHSTGGVDAHLLTLERPLAARSFSDLGGLDARWLQDRIRSVISVASPHQGTCLAVDPMARWLSSDSVLTAIKRAPAALGTALKTATGAIKSLPTLLADPELRQLLHNVLSSDDAARFLWDLIGSRALIDDLDPMRSVGRYAEQGSPRDVLRRSFVTIAGISASERRSAIDSAARTKVEPKRTTTPFTEPEPSPPDALFLLLSEATAGRNTGCSEAPLLPGSLERVRAALRDPAMVISASPQLPADQVDAASNDGIVNTARQLIDPAAPDELAAALVADHFDVVGHYDRSIWVSDPKSGSEREEVQNAGLLHSRSAFRDDQFFVFMRRIVDAMMPALG